MKRIVYDVPRWSLYLHRAARGLGRADEGDTPDLKIADELFERIFAGEVDAIPEGERYALLADWAQRVHDTVSQLPAFERLAHECRGRADEAAMAVEALVEALRPDDADDELRRSARTACRKASVAVEQLREAMEGLEHVSFAIPGAGNAATNPAQPQANVRSLAARLRESARLRDLATLAGRFKRIAGTKRRSRVRHGADEIVDVEVGAELARLLPLELVLLVHARTKLLAMRNLLERSCLQYRLEAAERLGKGPLVVCVDKSGSMNDGGKDLWATAVALALLDVAQAERRPFALLCFDAHVKHESLVMPGDSLPEAGLFVPADGGTCIDAVVRRGLELIEHRTGGLHKADLVVITDGDSPADEAVELRERAAKLDVSVLGVAIDVEPERLSPWCDDVVPVHDMSMIDETTAGMLFDR